MCEYIWREKTLEGHVPNTNSSDLQVREWRVTSSFCNFPHIFWYFSNRKYKFIMRKSQKKKKTPTLNKRNNDASEYKFFHEWVDQEYVPCGEELGMGFTFYWEMIGPLQCPRPKKEELLFPSQENVRKWERNSWNIQHLFPHSFTSSPFVKGKRPL